MELQRHAMLMYTSCGWFFDELSGIETVQVIQYAGRVVQLSEELKAKGIRGILKIGRPNNALYEVPVGMDRAGMVIVGGLNPIAALEESGVPTESKAMSILYEYSEMKPCTEFF
jgi:repressor of nif and glnA expression